MRARKFYATCDHGFEALLVEELRGLGASRIEAMHRGVQFYGDGRTLWRANLRCRVANRILMPIAEFPAADRASLYAGARRIDWPRWFDLRRTFALDASSHRSTIQHTAFIGQVIKDSICDSFRGLSGRRPDVDKRRPDVPINARLTQDRCTISLDASGERLHRRGYRRASGPAPLKETLAAGILGLAGYDGSLPVFDPMCGAGTLVIEAALIARNIGPGLLRLSKGGPGFAFQRWNEHDADGFRDEVESQMARIRPQTVSLTGSDIEPNAIKRCVSNAEFAGVSDGIEWICQSMESAMATAPEGLLVVNPPYGERLNTPEGMEMMFSGLGAVFKHNFPGWTAWIIASESAPWRSIRLRTSSRSRLRNGAIPCRLHSYRMFRGRET